MNPSVNSGFPIDSVKKRPLISALLCGWLVFQTVGSGALRAQESTDERKPEIAAVPQEILRNGDFEKSNSAGDWPADWGSYNPGTGKTWESENGGHFVRLASQKPGQLQMLYRSVKLVPGKVRAMKVTVRYRSSGVKNGEKPGEDARALFAFQDAEGRLLDSRTPPLLFSGKTSGWTEASGSFLIPAEATRWILMAGLLRAERGTIDVKEIRVAPLDETGTAALLAAAPKAEAPAGSWVENGNFSKPGRDEKWPAGWGDQPAPGMSWEKEDGRNFVRLVSQEPEQRLMLYKTVPLKPGVKGIELRIRFRTDGVRYGQHEWFDARTIVHFLGADGQKVADSGGDFVFTHKPEKTGWIDRVKSYAVPEGATQVQLMPGLFKARAGTVDLSEIQVTPMKEANAGLLDIANAAYRIWKNEEDAATDRKVGKQIDALLEASGNLLPNGGFEVMEKNGEARGWGKGNEEGTISLREEKGEHFMRLVSNDPEKTRMLYRMIPLPLGLKAIEVKIRYRTDEIIQGDRLPGDARAVMHFMNGTRFGHLENGKQLAPSPAAIVFSPKAREWTEVSRRYAVPEGATKLQFMPALWNVKSGILDLAEIRIVPVNEAEARAMMEAETAGNRQKAERAELAQVETLPEDILHWRKCAGRAEDHGLF